MTLLGKIRSRPWILIAFIALALLAFVINPETIEKAFGKNPEVFGKVNGEEITRSEFQDQLFLLQQQAEAQGQPATGLEEQAWQLLVQSKLIKQEFEKMGMVLTDELFWNQLQYDPMFAQNPQYFDEKGKFKVQEMKKEVEAMLNSGQPEQIRGWNVMRKSIEYRMMARLLFANISSGITSNKKEAAEIIRQRDEVADIEYVKVDYAQFANSNPVKVTTQDLADFIKKYPSRFKSDESRNLGIVFFPSKPSPNDEKVAYNEINKLYSQGNENFQNTASDSLFVISNSDVQNSYGYMPEQQLPREAVEFAKSASAGQFFGPYKDGDNYIVSKFLSRGDATMAKHILIAYKSEQMKEQKRTKEEAEKLAKEIEAKVKENPLAFNEFLSVSDDPGSAQQGGSVGWTLPDSNQFVKPFGDFVKASPKGAVGVVESQFGYHIIVIEDKMPVYKMASLVKNIKTSEATENKVHTLATNFIQQIQGKSFNEFANVAKKGKFNFQNPKSVKRFQGNIQGLGTDKDNDILVWAFDKKREKGDTDIITTSNGDRIVVYLNGKTEAGLADPESVREQIEPIVKNKLLAKKIIEKINRGKIASLDQAATTFNSKKEIARVNLLTPSVGNALEPKVAGAAFGVAKGKLSQPVEGNTGVYLLVKKSVAAQKQPSDLKQMMETIAMQNAGVFGQALLRSLQDNATIEDYRIEVYNKLPQQ